MHAITIVIIVGIAVKTSQLPQNGGDISTNNITPAAASPETNSTCVTGKGLSGTCVRREGCDYGPGSIDFSLYQPRGFKKICASGEVCCPREYIVQQDNKTWVTDNDFDFDDDD